MSDGEFAKIEQKEKGWRRHCTQEDDMLGILLLICPVRDEEEDWEFFHLNVFWC